LSTESQILGTVVGGTCPTADFDDNYLYLQFGPAADLTNSSDREFFGTFHWDIAQSGGFSRTRYGLESGYPLRTYDTPPITGTCKDGFLTTTAFNAYLAPGAAMVKSTRPGAAVNGDGLVGMPAVTLGSLAALEGTYAGFVYDGAATTKVHPITASAESGTLYLASVSATDLVTVDPAVTGRVTLTDVDAPSAGFIEGTIAGSRVVCMAAQNVASSGKTAVYCLGQNPTKNSLPFVLVLGSTSASPVSAGADAGTSGRNTSSGSSSSSGSSDGGACLRSTCPAQPPGPQVACEACSAALSCPYPGTITKCDCTSRLWVCK
jgi:hypothetical protein